MSKLFLSVLVLVSAAFTGTISSLETILNEAVTEADTEKLSPEQDSVSMTLSAQADSIFNHIDYILNYYAPYPCLMPGAIPLEVENSCRHPLYNYRKELSSTNSSNKTERVLQAQKALHTFRWFSLVPSLSPKKYDLRFQDFIELTRTEEDEVEEMPWILEKLLGIWEYLGKIVEKVFMALISPLKKLSPVWKAIFIAAFSFLLIIGLMVISRFTSKFFPRSSEKSPDRLSESKKRVDWISDAQLLLQKKMYTESVISLYKWLLEHIDFHRIVRRYEWWTNRQLLDLLKQRQGKYYPVSEKIIKVYEKSVYGHHEPDAETVEDLLESAADSRSFK